MTTTQLVAVLQSFSPIPFPLVRFAREFHFGERGAEFCTTELYPRHTHIPCLTAMPSIASHYVFFSAWSSCTYFSLVLLLSALRCRHCRLPTPLTVVVGVGGCGAHSKQHSSPRHPSQWVAGEVGGTFYFCFSAPLSLS